MSTEDATVNADGTSTFDDTQAGSNSNDAGGSGDEFDEPPILDTEEIIKAAKPAIDPAVYFLLAVIIVAAAYYYFVYRKKSTVDEDEFFSNLDGDKVSAIMYHRTEDFCYAPSLHPFNAFFATSASIVV